MDSSRLTRLQKILNAVIIINALFTVYLLKTVREQNQRIQTLERNDSIKRSVDKLNDKVDGLKQRIQGLIFP